MAKEKKKVPNLSFKGFTDDWEQRKLGEVADVKDGTHDSPRYINEGYPLLTSKNVGNGYINYDDVKYVSENDYVQINKRSKVDINDILMGMIGTIGNLALIREEPDFAIKNVALIKHTSNFDYQFLFQELQTSAISKELLSGMDGGTQKFVSLKKIRNLSVMLPSETEHKQIGAFFKQFDSLIALQQRKLDLLKQLKKGFLQKMFAEKNSKQPVLRFKGFHDDWEQHKLGEIITYYNGKSHEEQFRNAETQNFELVTLKSIDGNGNLCSSEKYIDSTNNTLSKNDLIMVLSEQNTGLVGMTTLIPRDNYYVLNQRVALLKLHKNNSPFFLTDAINQHQIFFERMSAGTKVQNISKSNVENFNLYIPNYSEQKEVGHIIALCQNIITLQHQKLAKYQSVKKSLLQQMFI